MRLQDRIFARLTERTPKRVIAALCVLLSVYAMHAAWSGYRIVPEGPPGWILIGVLLAVLVVTLVAIESAIKRDRAS